MNGLATIEAFAYDLAPDRISSTEIEEQLSHTLERFGIPIGQMERLTGIKERRFNKPGKMPSEAATDAARKVIAESGIDPCEIGCLINTSVCKDYLEPSVAALVQGNLGLPSTCMNFDIGNACLGFVNAIDITGLMIKEGRFKYGLIVDGECSREINESAIKKLQRPEATLKEFKENFATLTLGSGAAAMILSHKDISRTGHIINDSVSSSATQHSRLCVGNAESMTADPAGVLKHGVELAHLNWKLACRQIKNWSDETIDIYVPHQVGERNMIALNKVLGLTPEKHHSTFETLGNIGPAALPVTLAMAVEANRIKKGDHVALMGIGSGLNCTMMSVTW